MLINKENIVAENSGAPGGCLCVSSEIMDEIGGYSPELYWGYCAEDAEIWCRLECFFNKKQATGTHLGSALYADNPPIEIYHFSHPRAQSLNHNFDKMQECYQQFINLSYEEQMEIIEFKSKEFKKQKQLINEIKQIKNSNNN